MGPAADTAEAEGFALRLAELAEELGAVDMAVHGRSLLAIMARFSGRLDEAAAPRRRARSGWTASSTTRATPGSGWAATFAVAVARGAAEPGPAVAPVDSPDPVVGMALLVIEAELTVAGRVDEALARFDVVDRPELGPFGDLAGVLNGLALVLAGRRDEALPWVERAAQCGRGPRGARPRSPRPPRCRRRSAGTGPGSPRPRRRRRASADALVLRAHAARGDAARPRGPAAERATRSPCRACSSGCRGPPASGPETRQLAADVSCPSNASASLWRIGNDPPQCGQRT